MLKTKLSRTAIILMTLFALSFATLVTAFANGADGKAELIAELDKFEAADKNKYTSQSYAAWQSAYNIGIIINNTPDSTDNDYLTAANMLKNAHEALVLRGDKTSLRAKLPEIAAIDLAPYTPETAEALRVACANAQAVIDDIDATEIDVTNALAELEAKRGALKTRTDFSALEIALAKAKAIDLSLYTAEGASLLRAAIAAGETVAANPNSSQSAADSAAEKLTAAISSLSSYGNPEKLVTAVTEIQNMTMLYTKETLEPLLTKCGDALLLVEKGASPSEISTMLSVISVLKSSLTVREDKETLNALITAASEIDPSDYYEEGYNAFTEAVKAAKKVLDAPYATEEEVASAIESMESANTALEENERLPWWGIVLTVIFVFVVPVLGIGYIILATWNDW
jgi:hypothetical protein